MSGTTAAKRAGISQSSISRYERGLFVPSVEDITALANIYQAPPKVRQRMLQMVRDLREDATPPARVIMKRHADEMQARIGRIEAASGHIRNFHPAVVSGLLQTADYMRTVFASGGDLPPDQQAKALNARLERQELLVAGAHEFTAVMTEGALRWLMGGPAVMVAQIEHIMAVSTQPHVHVGVIPWTTSVDVAPMHGFDLFDERAAVVGTETATAFLTNPHDVAAYVKLFSDLAAFAVFGDDAQLVLQRVARDLRTLL